MVLIKQSTKKRDLWSMPRDLWNHKCNMLYNNGHFKFICNMKYGSHGCPRNSLGSNNKVQDHRNFLRDAWVIHHSHFYSVD
jgi:hypothetical protein